MRELTWDEMEEVDGAGRFWDKVKEIAGKVGEAVRNVHHYAHTMGGARPDSGYQEWGD
jgi:hypothetical protein